MLQEQRCGSHAGGRGRWCLSCLCVCATSGFSTEERSQLEALCAEPREEEADEVNAAWWGVLFPLPRFLHHCLNLIDLAIPKQMYCRKSIHTYSFPVIANWWELQASWWGCRVFPVFGRQSTCTSDLCAFRMSSAVHAWGGQLCAGLSFGSHLDWCHWADGGIHCLPKLIF